MPELSEDAKAIVASNLTLACYQLPAAADKSFYSTDEKDRETIQEEVWRIYQDFLRRLTPQEEPDSAGDR